ncbi:hypothetical protein TcG_12819 [Trypanosoma cruzi]|nr:hypothetical protein TcG_12819 [Trypanosoma cruzi]
MAPHRLPSKRPHNSPRSSSVRACGKRLRITPLGTFSAPTLTAPTSLERPRSLSSYNWPKAEMSELRRTTVERRLRISSIALPDDCVGQFERSGGASAVRCADCAGWWEVADWMELPPLLS